jgi:hypothetical protein
MRGPREQQRISKEDPNPARRYHSHREWPARLPLGSENDGATESAELQ